MDSFPVAAHRGHRVAPAAVILVVALLAVGCSSGGSDASTASAVRPFADVQASDFAFEADPNDPERAIFHVTTTEAMICAIVWGETEAFGNLNNSLAMNGTGLVRHDVFLPGAVPGRPYRYRVQGSTADGTIYQSDIGTFTIPVTGESATTDTAPPGPDLAIGATVTAVSSEFDTTTFAAGNAIDGSGTTEWSSAGDGDDASITIDLGEVMAVAGVEFITRSMADGTAIARTYSVTVDGGEAAGPFPAGTAAAPNFAPLPVSGRVFRFDVDTSTGGNVGAVEVRIIGPAG